MHYRVFYCLERCGGSVSSASAVEMSARTICEQLLPRLQAEDDYLGIIDPKENILQILCERDAGRYWVELPMDAAKASYGKHMSLCIRGPIARVVRYQGDPGDGLPALVSRVSFPDPTVFTTLPRGVIHRAGVPRHER